MRCKVTLMGYLNRYMKDTPEDFEVEIHAMITPSELLEAWGIPFSEVEAVFIDGKMASFLEPIYEVRHLKFLPIVSGG